MAERVAVAISGGTDSLLALVLLAEAGHPVDGVHAFFTPPGPDDLARADALQTACRRLGVGFHLLDLAADFRTAVIEPFIAEHVAGRTPNPCATCNRTIKFGLLMDRALGATGAALYATGHYAAVREHPVAGPSLARGADPGKDQSYFLSLVDHARFSRVRFPLSGLHKTAVRAELARRSLTPPCPRESQEICFVPEDDHLAYLQASGADLGGPGPAILADGTPVGRHKGLWRYTLGQRRGLGIAYAEPLYVIAKRPADNTLVLGTKAEREAPGCTAQLLSLHVPPEHWPATVLARTRYRQQAAPATARVHDDRMEIVFASSQELPTPGQVAALYDGDGFVLAGGIISET